MNTQFKGYTLAELRQRRELNTLEQQLLTERLNDTVYMLKHGRPSVVTAMSAFNRIMSYADIIGAAVASGRRVRSLFGRLK